MDFLIDCPWPIIEYVKKIVGIPRYSKVFCHFLAKKQPFKNSVYEFSTDPQLVRFPGS